MTNAAEILNQRSNDILSRAIDEAYLMGAYAFKRLAGMSVSESELYDSAYNVTQSNLVYSDIPVFLIRRNAELLRAAYIAGYNDAMPLPVRRNLEPKFKVGDDVIATTYDGETINGIIESIHSNLREVYYIVMTENGTIGAYEEFVSARNVPSVTIYPVIGLYGDVRNDERIKVITTFEGGFWYTEVSFERLNANNWQSIDTVYGLRFKTFESVAEHIEILINELYRRHLKFYPHAGYFQQNPGRSE